MKDEIKPQTIYPTEQIGENQKIDELAERLAKIFIAQVKFNKKNKDKKYDTRRNN